LTTLYAHANDDGQRSATVTKSASAGLDMALEKLARYLDAVGVTLDGMEAGTVPSSELDRARALYDAWEESREELHRHE
jgi:hypothetical protein